MSFSSTSITSTLSLASWTAATSTARTNGGIIYSTGASPITTTITTMTASNLNANTGSGGGFYYTNSRTTSFTISSTSNINTGTTAN